MSAALQVVLFIASVAFTILVVCLIPIAFQARRAVALRATCLRTGWIARPFPSLSVSYDGRTLGCQSFFATAVLTSFSKSTSHRPR